MSTTGGFTNIVRSLIASGVIPDPPTNSLFEFQCSSPLIAALLFKRYEVAELILESGTDISLYDMEESFTLFLAADLKIRHTLLDRGLDIHRVDVDTGNTFLHRSCGQYVDIAATELLLDNGLDVNQTNDARETPLNWAIRACAPTTTKQDVVRLLLSRGAHLTASCNAQGESPLHIALEDPQMTKFLLQLGAEVNAIDLNDLTALGVLGTLDFAIYYSDQEYQTAKALIDGGASLEINLAFALRLLKRAIHSGHVAYVRLLLEAWASQIPKEQPIPTHTRFAAAALLGDVETLRGTLLADWRFLHDVSADAPSSLVAAVRSKNPEAIRLIESYLPRDRQTPALALSEALAHESDEMLRLLLARVKVIGVTDMIRAVTSDSCRALSLLLDRLAALLPDPDGQASPTYVDEHSPSFWIPQIITVALRAAAKHGQTKAAALLLQFSVQHELDCSTFDIPLLSAIKRGQEEIALMIIHHTHALDTLDDEGHTPLMHAASRGLLPIVKALLEAGVDPSKSNSRGISPIALAAAESQHEVVQYLTETDPLSTLLPPNDTRTHRARMHLLAHAARHNLSDLGDYIMTHPDIRENLLEIYFWAARHGKHHLVDRLLGHAPLKLLRRELYAYRRAETNQTALIYAVSAPEERLSVVEILLRHGVDLDAGDNQGRTALSHAVEKGYAQTARLLVAAGASITQVDEEGKSPLNYAPGDEMTTGKG
ncbi:ankyrin repeat-containing domain protein [Aspergillus heterothallicus]